MIISIKKLAIMIGVLFVFIFIANYLITNSINNMKRSELNKTTVDAVAKSDMNEKDKVSKTGMRPWKEISLEKAEELKKLGIRIKPRNYGPKTVDQWTEYVGERIEESQAFESEEAKEVIKSVQVSKKEYNDLMKVSKEHEEIIKEQLSEDPFNKENKDRLQNIYKLQAINITLKDKVIIKNDSLVMDEVPLSPEN